MAQSQSTRDSSGESPAGLTQELRRRIIRNLSSNDAWWVLRDQSTDMLDAALAALRSYASLWISGDVGQGKRDELFTAAERDFEQGLKFERQVEKGSHLKPATLPAFRTDCLRAYCELVERKIEDLIVGDEGQADDQKEEEEEEEILEDEEEDEDRQQEDEDYLKFLGQNEKALSARRDAKAQSRREAYVGQIYERLEEQFKGRLQVLVHQHRMMEKKAKKT